MVIVDLFFDLKEKIPCRNTGNFFEWEKSVFVYADLFAVLAQTLKLNFAACESKESIVAALTNIYAGVNVCSTLTNDDGACINKLTVASFRAESFRFGITAVTG